jgi:hypothetical protein
VGTIAVTIHRLLYVLVVFFNRLIASFYRDRQLHNARLARIDELANLLSSTLEAETNLLLGASHFTHVLRVRPTKIRSELGNLLIVAPTRGGKGLLATSQLLTWQHSVVVNDIKGELFTQTAGYRSTLGKVFVIDPSGVGHRYDPCLGSKQRMSYFPHRPTFYTNRMKDMASSSHNEQSLCLPSSFLLLGRRNIHRFLMFGRLSARVLSLRQRGSTQFHQSLRRSFSTWSLTRRISATSFCSLSGEPCPRECGPF